ncbi:MAG: hypothetical protein WBF79_00535 [Rhodococcus sp. (in: high G+C Gram-positive bacteria)]
MTANRPAAQSVPFTDVALVAVGGALGTAARFVAVDWSASDSASAAVGLLPTTAMMLAVGSFALGAVLRLTTRSTAGYAHPLRTFTIGACGGFASFSLYAVAGAALSTAWVGAVFLVVTPILALAAMAVGSAFSGLLLRR